MSDGGRGSTGQPGDCRTTAENRRRPAAVHLRGQRSGIGNAPLALLWVAAAVGLGYMGFFAPESNRTKAFRAGFFALLISSAILAVIIRKGLAGMH